MSSTTVPTECPSGAVPLDFATARSALIEARLRLSKKDSPGNRTSVAQCWAWIDCLLDLLLDADDARPVRSGG
jgi:hypothetical protein